MIRIAITGPESTGKTTLAEALASELGTVWVPEFARDYLLSLGRTYTEEDLLHIARGQLKSEVELEPHANKILICDTEMLVMKVWSKYRYGRVHPEIERAWTEGQYDLFFLCAPDIPWEDDPLREHPEKRDELFEWYKNELESSCRKFIELRGSEKERLQYALNEIRLLLK